MTSVTIENTAPPPRSATSTSSVSHFPTIQYERLTRVAIPNWQGLLTRQFSSLNANNTRDFGSLCEVYNQFALLKIYQGDFLGSKHICEAQIKLWMRLAKEQNDSGWLINAIQPWINLKRLQRWNCDYTQAKEYYLELSPTRLNQPNSLNTDYHFPLTLTELLKLDDDGRLKSLINAVFWIEYLKLLSTTSEHGELMHWLTQGLSSLPSTLRIQLTEVWYSTLINNHKFNYALESLEEMNLLQDSKYSAAFQLIEIILLYNMKDDSFQGKAEKFVDSILKQLVTSHDASSLCQLLDICKHLEKLNQIELTIPLLKKLNEAAISSQDEVLTFEARFMLNRLSQYSLETLSQEFATSRYQVIKNRLLDPYKNQTTKPNSQEIEMNFALLSLAQYSI